MKKSLPIIAVAAVIAVGIFLLIAQSSQKTTDDSSEPQTNSTMLDNDTANPDIEDSSESTEASACQTPPANTVSYCDGKFNDLTVPAGTVVTFRNDSDRVVQPSSDPHPQHTLNTELNVGFMNPGQTKTVTLTKKGTWSIHNHIRAEESAKITVQ